MTQIFPISSATPTPTTAAPAAPDNQFGKDAFLKLLVAQLKYQNPLSPTDSTQFMQQTAQFTMLETLQKIEKEQAAQQSSSQVLSASSMIGRAVTYGITTAPNEPPHPTATTVVSVHGTLPRDAVTGSHTSTTTEVFTRAGTKVPIKLDFARGDAGWTVQASSNGHALGAPLAVAFDASGDHTSTNLTIPARALNDVAGTTGGWPSAGITLAFGGSNDPTRLQLAPGAATVSVVEQNGNDGATASGVVTGIHITADGPTLVVGGNDIPLASVTGVHA